MQPAAQSGGAAQGQQALPLILSGTANKPLAESIAKQLGVTLAPCVVGRFADGEINIHVGTNIRGADVFLVQPVCPPTPNDHLMELLLLVHTLKLSSARRITVVMPYYGYARQDRKVKPRTPISASAVAQLIECMGPTRLLTVDLHCGQIQGFFHQIPVDNLFAEDLFLERLKTDLAVPADQLVIVSPDAGGVTRARRVADKAQAQGVVTILKRRAAANVVDSMQLVGDVSGRICFIFDDIADTLGTICGAAALLLSSGAKKVYACATHGLFSGEALERLKNCVALEAIYVTDSIPQAHSAATSPKIRVVSLVPLLANAVQRLHEDKSLSELFGGHT